jgi:hypothetical protein
MKVREAREFIEDSVRGLKIIAELCKSEEPDRSDHITGNSIPALTTAIHALKKIEAEMGNVEFVGVDKDNS